MEIRFMGLMNVRAMTLMLVGLAGHCTASFADPPEAHPYTYECPQEWTYQGVHYPLRSVAVFDGPIEHQYILKPEEIAGDTATWPFPEGSTPFMRCRYQDTNHYVVIEAKGARLCQATLHENQPNTGFCQ